MPNDPSLVIAPCTTPALVEQAYRLFQILAAGHAEAEVVKAHPVRVEAVIRGRQGPQPHQQVPRIMTTPPNKMGYTSAADGSSSGGDSTAIWKPSRLV